MRALKPEVRAVGRHRYAGKTIRRVQQIALVFRSPRVVAALGIRAGPEKKNGGLENESASGDETERHNSSCAPAAFGVQLHFGVSVSVTRLDPLRRVEVGRAQIRCRELPRRAPANIHHGERVFWVCAMVAILGVVFLPRGLRDSPKKYQSVFEILASLGAVAWDRARPACRRRLRDVDIALVAGRSDELESRASQLGDNRVAKNTKTPTFIGVFVWFAEERI